MSDKQQFVRKIYKKRVFHPKAREAVIEKKRRMLELIHRFVPTLVYLLPPESSGDDCYVWLVDEYETHGCLFAVLWSERKVSESGVRLSAADIFVGLFFLHQRKITYRDLAPDSILLIGNGRVKLRDPGLLPLGTRRKEYLT
jgi:serine/threonine protein kinase